MSCNCKEEKYDNVKKYSDDGKRVLEPLTGVKKVGMVILRIIIGVLLSVIVIITLPFVVIYVVFSAVFGKGVTIDFKKIIRRHNERQ